MSRQKGRAPPNESRRLKDSVRLTDSRQPGESAPSEVQGGARRTQRAPHGGLEAPVLAEIARRPVAARQPERVYRFGSGARSEAGPASDDDLRIVVPQLTEPSDRLEQRAHRLLWETGTAGAAVDILVWSREAFDRRLRLKALLPATFVEEGRLLYAG
jgi:predicted nucleotidyltransferase